MSTAQAPEAGIHWYRTPIDKETMARLTARSDWRGCCQIIPQLLLTTATGAFAFYAYRHFAWPAVVAAWYLHVTIYSFLGLSGAGHELIHGTVFKTRIWNRIFMYLVGFLTWTDCVFFWASHTKHHQYTLHAGLDLEVVPPINVRGRDFILPFTVNPPAFWFTLRTTIRRSRGIMRGEWEERLFPPTEVKKREELIRWSRILLFGHLTLAIIFIACKLWFLLTLITFAPFCAQWLNMLCGLTQHTGLPPNVPDFRRICRSVTLNPLLRFLYWHMNYHVEHHMYAAIPCYRLVELRAVIAHDLPPASPGLIAAWREINTILRRQHADPDYVYTPPLPQAIPEDAR